MVREIRLANPITNADPLADLIAFDATGRAVWPIHDLRALLDRPLPSSLTLVCPDSDSIRTFWDLLHHPAPPAELLGAVKDQAKIDRLNPSADKPPEFALLLYYGCIAVARIRIGRRITSLSEEDLRRGMNWIVRQPWIDPATRQIFLECLRQIRQPQSAWRI
jgi:hypothetical protein